jgi:hypothetical protein
MDTRDRLEKLDYIYIILTIWLNIKSTLSLYWAICVAIEATVQTVVLLQLLAGKKTLMDKNIRNISELYI